MPEQLTILRRTQILWRFTAAVDGLLTWLTRKFTPTPQVLDLEPRGNRPFSIYGPG
jgi:hypothetical protein